MAPLTDARKMTLRREMEALLGKGAVLSDPEELLVYESDGLTLFRALADFVVFPQSAEHVSALVKLAQREEMPFVARGAGTGLSGGCLPAEGGLVISLMRMNRVLEVDYANQIAVPRIPPASRPAPSVATSPTTRAARTPSSTASPPTTCWAWKWCSRTVR